MRSGRDKNRTGRFNGVLIYLMSFNGVVLFNVYNADVTSTTILCNEIHVKRK